MFQLLLVNESQSHVLCLSSKYSNFTSLAMHTGCYIIQVQGDPKSEVTLVTQIFKVLINVLKYLWH